MLSNLFDQENNGKDGEEKEVKFDKKILNLNNKLQLVNTLDGQFSKSMKFRGNNYIRNQS